ncbi:sulfite exporter TauE/SafE family protein [Candidatus Margulisiibacteriota bacterium]
MPKKILEKLQKIPRTILIGASSGFISGLLGLGGGIIFVPALLYLLKIPQRTAQGTALTVIIPTALSGSIRYYLAGNLDLNLSVWIAAGSMFGVLAGSLFAHKLHPNVLRRSFGAFMLVVAIKMFLE